MPLHADDFIRHLGQADDHPDLQRTLARLGVKKAPKVQGAATDARLALPAHGVELVFAPVDGNRRHGLELAEVRLHGGPAQGAAKAFAGRLPFELAFADARADARKKVGPPAHVNDAQDHDAWDYQTHTLTAHYSRDRKRIIGLTLSLPYDGEDD